MATKLRPEDSRLETARTAIDAKLRPLEALTPDQVTDAALAEVRPVIEALHAEAAEPVCPSRALAPVDAAALADFERITGELPIMAAGLALVDWHGRALAGGHNGLCRAIRSTRALTIVRDAARTAFSRSGLDERERADFITAEVRRFLDGLAAQLRDAFPRETGVMLDEVPALERRLEAVSDRRADRARSIAAGLEAERLAQAAAAADEDAQERLDCFAYFMEPDRLARRFVLGPDTDPIETFGAELASAARDGAPARLANIAIKFRRELLRLPGRSAAHARTLAADAAELAEVIRFFDACRMRTFNATISGTDIDVLGANLAEALKVRGVDAPEWGAARRIWLRERERQDALAERGLAS